jgi:hypothetical protein
MFMDELEKMQQTQNEVRKQVAGAIIAAINAEIYSLNLSTKMSVRLPSQGMPTQEELDTVKTKIGAMFDFKIKMESMYGIVHDTAMDEQYGYDSLNHRWIR